MIEGLIKLLDSNIETPINLGNPDETTIINFASEIIKMTNSKSELEYQDLPIDDPKIRCPDISLAIEKLDWKPKISLGTGLE